MHTLGSIVITFFMKSKLLLFNLTMVISLVFLPGAFLIFLISVVLKVIKNIESRKTLSLEKKGRINE